MAPPSYFATSFYYNLYSNILDVNDYFAAIRDALTVQLPVGSRWVESPALTFTSPVDAAGRFYKLTYVRSSATIATVKLTDRFAQNDTEGFVITGAGQTLEISCSAAHLYTWLPDGSCWHLSALCDPSPEALNAMTVDTVWKSRKNSAGNDNSFPLICDRWQGLNPTPVTMVCAGPWFSVGNGTPQIFTAGGSILFIPCTCLISSPVRFVGHLPHIVWVDNTLTGNISVPLDAGVVGLFKKLPGIGLQAQGFGTQAGIFAPRIG